MISKLRTLIRESIEAQFLCEVRVSIKDEKQRGFADQLGQMYKSILKPLKPLKIIGRLGLESAVSSYDASAFIITLENGDVIHAVRNTNPAFGKITVNDDFEKGVGSAELFTNKFPELIKKYYSEYKTAKSGIPSI